MKRNPFLIFLCIEKAVRDLDISYLYWIAMAKKTNEIVEIDVKIVESKNHSKKPKTRVRKQFYTANKHAESIKINWNYSNTNGNYFCYQHLMKGGPSHPLLPSMSCKCDVVENEKFFQSS